jgi:hypothetical protein
LSSVSRQRLIALCGILHGNVVSRRIVLHGFAFRNRPSYSP